MSRLHKHLMCVFPVKISHFTKKSCFNKQRMHILISKCYAGKLDVSTEKGLWPLPAYVENFHDSNHVCSSPVNIKARVSATIKIFEHDNTHRKFKRM